VALPAEVVINLVGPALLFSCCLACAVRDVSVSGHDLQSLLFNYLDELLFIYSTEYIMMKFIAVTSLDTTNFTVTATG
jgi:SHS2 domain-containing protein